MTRLELLQLAVARARANGFELRRWYTTRLGLPWISAEAAVTLLDSQRRYYALLFSHEFASAFWKSGADITFEVPAGNFQRTMPDGTVRSVKRKSFIRRSARPEAWRYHLQQMALAEDPLRHLRKYMHVEERLDPESAPAEMPPRKKKPGTTDRPKLVGKPIEQLIRTPAGKRSAISRAPSTDIPAFLKRPYKGV